MCDKSRVCVCARSRVGRCEIMAGAGNPWICGCELRADVSWNAAAGCVGRVAWAALCLGTQWQAVTMGVGRVARVVCVALCHGDCWWAPRGCRCAMGIAAGRVAWAPLCHGDCWWACCMGGAVPWQLLGSASSWWRRVLGIADQGVVCVAPCH